MVWQIEMDNRRHTAALPFVQERHSDGRNPETRLPGGLANAEGGGGSPRGGRTRRRGRHREEIDVGHKTRTGAAPLVQEADAHLLLHIHLLQHLEDVQGHNDRVG